MVPPGSLSGMPHAAPPYEPGAAVPTARDPHIRRLLERYAHERRPADLDALVEEFRPLALRLAHRYATERSRARADLEQAACEGLVKALQRFDPARGRPFVAYAIPTVLGQIRRHLRDTSWPLHMPRSLQVTIRAVRRASCEHAARTGREPTVAQLAARLDLNEEDIVEAQCAAATAVPGSLHERTGAGDALTLEELLGAPEVAYEQIERRSVIESALPWLSPQEQAVLRWRFEGELSHREIALRLGCSRTHAGRVLEQALSAMRDRAAA